MYFTKVCVAAVIVVLSGTILTYGDISNLPSQSNTRKPPATPYPDHYNIVLLGATGDLASRYLWHGLYDLFITHYVAGKVVFTIYACGRNIPDEGRRKLSSLLLNVVHCEDEKCREKKKAFIMATQYHQLKNKKHYEKLGIIINENTASQYGLSNDWSHEKGRLFYLAIPPSSYSEVAHYIHTYIRPPNARTWLKTAVEKPFGTDYNSAEQLMRTFHEEYKKQELYFIDHYLGKAILQLLLPFRYINRDQYEPLWNREHVERIEVVLKESIDVKNRISFYNDVGVIRDMLQNHATELLTVTAMELPNDSGNITQILCNKRSLLAHISPINHDSLLTGQYLEYAAHLAQSAPNSPDASTHPLPTTPTYAAALVPIDTPRWRGLPVIVTSGKQLEEKASYVRVLFKDPTPGQIVFYIGGEDPNRPPMILVSKTLPAPNEGSRMQFVDVYKDVDMSDSEDNNNRIMIHGEHASSMYQLMVKHPRDPYTVIIEDIFNARRDVFVDEETLMASWRIWGNVLDGNAATAPERHRYYPGGHKCVDVLSYTVKSARQIEFNIDYVPPKSHDVSNHHHDGDNNVMLSHLSFRGQPLVRGRKQDVIQQLVEDFLHVVSECVRDRGVCHIALSGGNSPIGLLQRLADHALSLPWQNIHIWFVDERCVELTSEQSNYNTAYVHLIRLITIPHLNIHPFPVNTHRLPICDKHSFADDMYEAEIKSRVPGIRFDWILLGIGSDGHTASLFPRQPFWESLSEDEYVIFSSDNLDIDGDPRYNRITMTPALINISRHIRVLVLGSNKNSVVAELRTGITNVIEYPITGISPTYGDLVWYIDDDALSVT